MIIFENGGDRPEVTETKWGKEPPRTAKQLLDALVEMTKNDKDVIKKTGVAFVDDSGRRLQLFSGEMLGKDLVVTAKPEPQPMPIHITAFATAIFEEVRKAKADLAAVPVKFTDGKGEFRIGGMKLEQAPTPEGVISLFSIELEEVEGGKIAGGDAWTGEIETAEGFIKALDGLAKTSGREVMSHPAVCRDGDGAVYTLNPRYDGGQASTLMTLQKSFEGLKLGDPEIKTLGEIAAWLKTRPPKSKLFLLASGKRTFGVEDITFEAGQPPIVQIAPWTDLFESWKEEMLRESRKAAKKKAERDQILEWKSYCDDEFIWW